MNTRLLFTLPVTACFFLATPAGAVTKVDPLSMLGHRLRGVMQFITPDPGKPTPAVEIELACENATGDAKVANGRSAKIKFQPPNRFWLSADVDGPVSMSSDGTKVWIHVPKKNMLLEGDASVPRFATRPDSVQATTVPALKIPMLTDTNIDLLLAMLEGEYAYPKDRPDGVLVYKPKEALVKSLGLPAATVTWDFGTKDNYREHFWPVSITYDDGKGTAATLRCKSVKISDQLPPDAWKPVAGSDDKVERVALSHLVKFVETAVSSIGDKIPTLPSAKGERKVVATEGKGRLEDHDGARVLFLEGTPEEMGRQQGVLLKKEINRVVDKILYGVGVGSSFAKGRWFFGEIEEAVRRTGPYIDPRHLREMDALADAVGRDREESRLSNFFPELFHCSGFALLGDSTEGGHVYHGRVLDYLRGMGLEENAVVMVIKPDQGNAWINMSYCGFIGSVTAMNEKHIAMGEMGGRGEGNWDGKPMAQLVREVMEKCSTLDEAIELMRNSKRTCEYYYVISDGRSKQAVGIKATKDIFEVIRAGEGHPQLAHPIKDTVLMSAGDRYEELVRRVKGNYGKFTADSARELMTRPVCMNSNIQSVLFAPDTLDLWVANADSKNVASATRYTKYNLAELLKPAPGVTTE